MSQSDPSRHARQSPRPSPGASRSATARPALFVAVLGVLLSGGAFLMVGQATADPTTIQVYKTPTCGCCTLWIDHLRASGFVVEATDLPDLRTLKAMNGVPNELSSCHTATVDGYVIEGHVPASDIRRLLAERPKIAGLAVPGMPMGSPGMEHPDATRHEAYDVIAFGGQDGGGQDGVGREARSREARGEPAPRDRRDDAAKDEAAPARAIFSSHRP